MRGHAMILIISRRIYNKKEQMGKQNTGQQKRV